MLSPDQVTRLQQTVQEGAIIRDWCRHPAFSLFNKWLESKIEDKKKEWLRASDEDAVKIRAQAATWLDIQDEFKRWMLSGDNAARMLQENTKELEENAKSE